MIRGGGVSRFCVENFLSHSAEFFRGGILYCCTDFGYRRSLDECRGRGGFKIFRIIFLTHSAEIFAKEIFYCCINLGYRKSLGKSGEGGLEWQAFPSKFFCLTVPKTSVGESFTVALN